MDARMNPPAKDRQSLSGFFLGAEKALGKTEARRSFLYLMDELQRKLVPLVVTDRGEKVAVIMGYKQYKTLLAALGQRSKLNGENPLDGLIVNVGDLEGSEVKVNALFQRALKRKDRRQ